MDLVASNFLSFQFFFPSTLRLSKGRSTAITQNAEHRRTLSGAAVLDNRYCIRPKAASFYTLMFNNVSGSFCCKFSANLMATSSGIWRITSLVSWSTTFTMV